MESQSEESIDVINPVCCCDLSSCDVLVIALDFSVKLCLFYWMYRPLRRLFLGFP